MTAKEEKDSQRPPSDRKINSSWLKTDVKTKNPEEAGLKQLILRD